MFSLDPRRLLLLEDGEPEELMGTIKHLHFRDSAGYMLRRFPPDARSVLDVGIGYGWLGALVKALGPGMVVDGIEPFDEYAARSLAVYDNLFRGTAQAILPQLREKSYDVVVCLEVLEHVENPLALISECERVTKKALFFSSPNLFVESHPFDGNEGMKHISLVTSRTMKKLGYTVRGAGSLANVIGAFGRRLPHLDTAWLAWKTLSL